jgi:hypothetical protein
VTGQQRDFAGHDSEARTPGPARFVRPALVKVGDVRRVGVGGRHPGEHIVRRPAEIDLDGTARLIVEDQDGRVLALVEEVFDGQGDRWEFPAMDPS